ncbi:hypothetical protein GLYMA_17G134400v4 [Glycine max]|uniref:Uncharacterized protein n=1 Tax=Glycine max TaxID=3847 RepID=A0A0R0FCV1_SOYBN|nr:hypothetical protein GYH30_047182 [Glycine max]KRH04017.1 hypothetical protein GLYMA_17G134400v4 [Glycine max]
MGATIRSSSKFLHSKGFLLTLSEVILLPLLSRCQTVVEDASYQMKLDC